MDFATTSDLSGESFKAAEHEGKLILALHSTQDEYDGDWGPTKIAVVDLLIVLDADDGPLVYKDAWVFGAALVPTLLRAKDQPFLGRVASEKSKNGRNVWVFEDASKKDMKAAAAWSKKFLDQGPTGRYTFKGNLDDPNEAPF